MNPKKPQDRGLDFEQRYHTSKWAEDRTFEAINQIPTLLCVRLGLSQTSKKGRAHVAVDECKAPDLLVFKRSALSLSEIETLADSNLTQQTSSALHKDPVLGQIISKACSAVEVEFSPFQARDMSGRKWKCVTPKNLLHHGKPRKHANPPIAPNIFVKLEDLPRLRAWYKLFHVPIVVSHIFDQEAFAVSLDKISEFERTFPKSHQEGIDKQLIEGIFRKEQSYDRTDAQAAGEKKLVFRVTPPAAIEMGDVSGVSVKAQIGLSTSKKYVAHILFEGGSITLTQQFLDLISGD